MFFSHLGGHLSVFSPPLTHISPDAVSLLSRRILRKLATNIVNVSGHCQETF